MRPSRLVKAFEVPAAQVPSVLRDELNELKVIAELAQNGGASREKADELIARIAIFAGRIAISSEPPK